ncbi:MAG TPA: AraC family transcriptional regulator [Pyrinomonadaceae bacterium]|nr:AraC family transcriptional regulator [Pyrinomonadaceae bacterium]
MDGRIFRVTVLLSENPQQGWTIREMATIAGVSTSYFQRLFRTETGITPIAYLREARLRRARELLETTFLLVKEIGMKTGMADESHFTRNFGARYGLTPTDYRRSYWDDMQTITSK